LASSRFVVVRFETVDVQSSDEGEESDIERRQSQQVGAGDDLSLVVPSRPITDQKGRTMVEPSISLSRDIPAPAERIFSVLIRPAAHPDVDGTGMVRGAPEEVVISKVGDSFTMNMFNDEMENYVMESRVVEFEPGRRIVWEPVLYSIEKPEFQSDVGVRAFHQWGWQLEPLDANRTRVTEFFDCSRSPEWLQKATKGGEQWRPGMAASLENLERLVLGSEPGSPQG
jgi:uncharacterized protein YndB with AHSA1/START domain